MIGQLSLLHDNMDIYLFTYAVLVIQQIIGFFSKDIYFNVKVGNGILSSKNNPINILMMVVVFFLLFFIFYLRSETIGTDYNQYLYFMDIMQTYRWGDLLSLSQSNKIEYIFLVLSKVMTIVTEDRYILMGCWYLVFIISLGIFFLRGCRRPYFSMYLFFSFGLFNQSMNITRQYVAASLLGLAFIFFLDKETKKFILAVIGATAIHTSAILGMTILLLKFDNIKKNIRIITLIGVGLSLYLAYNFSHVFSVLGLANSDIDYMRYIVTERFEGGLGIGLLINLLIYLAYFIFYKKFLREDDGAPLWLTCAALTLAINIVSINTSIIARLLIYFKIAMLVSIPRFIDSCIYDKKIKYFVYTMVVIVCGLYYMYILVNTPLYDTVPYIFR
ncbi:EpsG family protein [uncultured Veillonella sp.]|uniref:EpsG family protein n=1 Tax=uncultured Veillonella sp. TaxID=159268 RepID=UPI002594ABAC|nr:EpsG family protein [uncultured Veillonella sp.]